MSFALFQPDDTPPSGGALVRDIVRDYLACKQHELTPATFADTKKLCDLFVAMFGDRAYAALRPSQIKTWILGRPEWRAANTRWKKANTLKAVFNWAAEDRLIQATPLKGLSFPKGERRRDTTDIELGQLLEATTPAFADVLLFLRDAGCRPAEVRVLRWEWLKWSDDGQPRKAIIPPGEHKTGAKTGETKEILLTGSALAVVMRLWNQAKSLFDSPSGAIFLNSRRRPWTRSAFGQRLGRLREKTGLSLEATLHGLRHTKITELLANGCTLKQVADIIGHKSLATTARYAHLERRDDERLRLAALGNRKEQQGPDARPDAGPMLPFPD